MNKPLKNSPTDSPGSSGTSSPEQEGTSNVSTLVLGPFYSPPASHVYSPETPKKRTVLVGEARGLREDYENNSSRVVKEVKSVPGGGDPSKESIGTTGDG